MSCGNNECPRCGSRYSCHCSDWQLKDYVRDHQYRGGYEQHRKVEDAEEIIRCRRNEERRREEREQEEAEERARERRAAEQHRLEQEPEDNMSEDE